MILVTTNQLSYSVLWCIFFEIKFAVIKSINKNNMNKIHSIFNWIVTYKSSQSKTSVKISIQTHISRSLFKVNMFLRSVCQIETIVTIFASFFFLRRTSVPIPSDLSKLFTSVFGTITVLNICFQNNSDYSISCWKTLSCQRVWIK